MRVLLVGAAAAVVVLHGSRSSRSGVRSGDCGTSSGSTGSSCGSGISISLVVLVVVFVVVGGEDCGAGWSIGRPVKQSVFFYWWTEVLVSCLA
jgi:hypothetical protein